MANFRHVTKCRGGSGGDLPSFLPSGPLPHAEAGAFPDLETLGVPSLLCTRVSFELCAYMTETVARRETQDIENHAVSKRLLMRCCAAPISKTANMRL